MRLLLLLIFSLVGCGQHSQISSGTLKGGERVEVKPADTEEMLVAAINADDVTRMNEIIPSQWSVDQKLKSGRTPLTEACAQMRLSVVQALVKHGADIHLADEEGKSAADYAQTSSALKRLVFAEEALKQELALIMAVRNNKYNDVKKLLADGVEANWSITDERVPADLETAYVGETPLTLAILVNAEFTVRTLLSPSFSVDVNQKNDRGESPLSICRSRSLSRIEKMLLQRGAQE